MRGPFKTRHVPAVRVALTAARMCAEAFRGTSLHVILLERLGVHGTRKLHHGTRCGSVFSLRFECFRKCMGTTAETSSKATAARRAREVTRQRVPESNGFDTLLHTPSLRWPMIRASTADPGLAAHLTHHRQVLVALIGGDESGAASRVSTAGVPLIICAAATSVRATWSVVGSC